MSLRCRLLAIALGAAVLDAVPAHAAIEFEIPGFREEIVATGLPFPTAIAFAPDDRMFIALKSGIVRVWADGVLLPEPFVDLSEQVNDVFDRGLLDIELHPDFPASPYVYLLFTRDPSGVVPDGGGGRVARLVRVEADPAADHVVAVAGMDAAQNPVCAADPPPAGCPGHVVLLGRNGIRPFIGDEIDGRNTARASCMAGGSMGMLPLILPDDDPNVPYPSTTNPPIEDCSPVDERTHTIGTVAFAPDGSLFVSAGDGSNFNAVDPRALRAQMLDSLAGKILRIDAETGAGLPDNPFFDPSCPDCNRSKVWARGLRNPFRFAIDPATGEPVIGDVGWNTWEEVNRGRGKNFGWPCYEGAPATGIEGGVTVSLAQPGYAANPDTAIACAQLFARGAEAVEPPVFSYGHEGDGFGGEGGASVNAGAFYRGDDYPESLHGALFLLDYDRRWIRALRLDETPVTVIDVGRETDSGMVQVTEGPGGDLYVVVFSGAGGEVRRLRYTAGNTPPVAVAGADPVAGETPLTVAFTGAESFDPDGQDVLFHWDFGDGTVSSDVDPRHTYDEAGIFVATLTVTEATPPFAEATASVSIAAGVVPPAARILMPASGDRYRIGDRITFAGSGTVSGSPATAETMLWELRLRHNQHVHFSSLGNGDKGSFVVEEHGDATSIEICLTVAQSAELAATDCVALLPETTVVTIDSQPSAMSVVYEDEGLLLMTPAAIEPTVGSLQRLTVPRVQQYRSFVGWADGETASSREILVGTEPFDLMVLFENRPPTAVAGVAPRSGVAPLRVVATAAASADPEAGPLTYRWRFAGRRQVSSSRAEHTFALPGEYAVELTVVDPLGAHASDAVTVQVEAPACACALADADSDGDDVCDRLDVCGGDGRLTRTRVALSAGDPSSRISLRTAVEGAAAVDPRASGLRLRLRGLCGETLVDAWLPPGDGWREVRGGWRWRGRHAVLGRARVVVQRRASEPEVLWVRVAARRGAFDLGIDAAPAMLEVAWGEPPTACAEAGFTTRGRPCRSVGSGTSFRCDQRSLAAASTW